MKVELPAHKMKEHLLEAVMRQSRGTRILLERADSRNTRLEAAESATSGWQITR